MSRDELVLDPGVLVDRLLGKQRTELHYKVRKMGAGRAVGEPAVQLVEGLSDLRFASLVTIFGVMFIYLYNKLFVWGCDLENDKNCKGDASLDDIEFAAMELAVAIGLSMFALWMLGSAFKHMSGPEHEDPERLKQYFEALESLIPDHHADKAAILNPGKDAESCQKFYAFHTNALQHLLVTKKNPRAASYVITAIRRRLQHAPMDLEVFERQLGGDMLPGLTWDSVEGADSVASSDLMRRLAALQAADDDTERSVAGTPPVEGEDSEGSVAESMAAAELAEAADDTERRQAIIRRLLLSSIPGHTHAKRQAKVTALSEANDGRGFFSRVNDASSNIQSSGVIGNPAPALSATPFATPLLPLHTAESGEAGEADAISDTVSSAPSQARLGVIDHFNLALHDGEYIEALPTVLKGRKYAELTSHNIASRNAREQADSQLATPSYTSLNYPRGYLAEYIFADVGHTLRTHSHPEMQPRLDWLGSWFHYGRQVCHVTQVDRITYDRARVMAQSIRRLLKYRGPFEAEVAGRRHEQTLFDRALMFAALLCDVKALDDWQHWSQVGPFAHAVFSMLTTRQQVELTFTLMSGSPFTQLLARALVHDMGERQANDGTSYYAHTGYSHRQLNEFFKAYLAFMQEKSPGETPSQTDLRNVLFTEHLVLLTDGRQGVEPQDRRMMDYCQAHTRKPLEILTTLVQRLARLMSSYRQMITLGDSEGNRIELGADDLASQIGTHTEQEDLQHLLADSDRSDVSAVQQQLTQVQHWLIAYQENANDASLPPNIEDIANAARRMEARDKRFAVRYVAAYRAAKERAVEFFTMLRADQRGPAIMAMSDVNPESVLPLFDCDTPSTFATLRMMLPVNSNLTLLSTLLQPLLPSRHRHVWKVLIRLCQHHTDYEPDIINFLVSHVDVMLSEPSFRLMFDVADIAFQEATARQQFVFVVLKTINQSSMTALDKGRAIEALLRLGYQGQTVFDLIQTFASCCHGSNAKIFDHILQRCFAYRQRVLSHQATADDVIGLLGVDLSGLKDIISNQPTMDQAERVMTRCALLAWMAADRPRGPHHTFHTIDTFKVLCQVNDAHEHGMWSEDSSQRFECRKWLISTALPTLITTSDTTKYPAIIALLSAFGAAYPDKFGTDEFAVVRVFETCKRVLGQHEDRAIQALIQHDARFLWIYVRSFVVDPADVLATAGEEDVGLPTVAFADNAKALYDRLPSSQSSHQNPHEQRLSQLIWFPKRLSPRENTSADLGYMLTALMRHDKNNNHRKSMSLMRLQVAYLETKVGPRLDAAYIAACPAIYRQPLVDYIQQETRQCLRNLEQAFQAAVRQPGQEVDDSADIQVYWTDYVALASAPSNLPGQVGRCPVVERASFMTWLRMQIKQRGELEIAMVTGTETADEDFEGVCADFADQMNGYKLTQTALAQIPVCPANLMQHFDAFKRRFYPDLQWPGSDRDLRHKVWQQFRYAVITLNWFSKPWLEPGDRPQMLCDTLGQIEASLYVLAAAESSPNLDAQRSLCMRLVELLYPVYEQAVSTVPESQADQELVQDQFAGAEFTVDEQDATQRVLLALLKLPKPTDEQDKQTILSVAIKLVHVCLSSNVLTDNRFKMFYRDIVPRLMAYLRPLDFQHRDDAARLSDVWAKLPDSLQSVSHPDDGVDERPHVLVNTRVKQRLSLAYVCWRYHLYERTGSWSKQMNGLLSCLGATRSYTLLAAECVQQANRGFCQLPTDLGQSLSTSPACRNWLREHLAIEANPQRLVLDLEAAERGEAVQSERYPLLGPGAGIN